MSSKDRRFGKRRTWALYPFLVGALPAIHFYETNFRLLPARDLVRPILLSCLLVLLLVGAGRLIWRSWGSSALVLTPLLVVVFKGQDVGSPTARKKQEQESQYVPEEFQRHLRRASWLCQQQKTLPHAPLLLHQSENRHSLSYVSQNCATLFQKRYCRTERQGYTEIRIDCPCASCNASAISEC